MDNETPADQDDVTLIGKCGLFCGKCMMFKKNNCPSCLTNSKATWCKVRQCCTGAQLGSCADCSEYIEPKECKTFNALIARIFGFIFRSDRAACIRQIRELGPEEHARIMREKKQHTIKRK